jgi:hypothetical protein
MQGADNLHALDGLVYEWPRRMSTSCRQSEILILDSADKDFSIFEADRYLLSRGER